MPHERMSHDAFMSQDAFMSEYNKTSNLHFIFHLTNQLIEVKVSFQTESLPLDIGYMRQVNISQDAQNYQFPFHEQYVKVTMMARTDSNCTL
jgi:hypothetical protein